MANTQSVTNTEPTAVVLSGDDVISASLKSYIVINDYVVELKQETNGFTLTVHKSGSPDKAVRVYALSEAEKNAILSAETSRSTAETSRVNAELARVAAEKIRNDKEIERNANEATRKQLYQNLLNFYNEAITKEAERVSNETARVQNESLRQSLYSQVSNAETTRTSNETTRQSNEDTRQANEQTRITNDSARTTSENTRKSNELVRQSNEQVRINNEQLRQSNELEREEAETSRQSSEETRTSEFNSIKTDFNKIKNMSVSAESVANNQSASVTKTTDSYGNVSLHYKIPKGADGNDGTDGIDGKNGIYVGTTEPADKEVLWVDPTGEPDDQPYLRYDIDQVLTETQKTKVQTNIGVSQLNADIAELQTGKQDALTAGENITIVDNVISATGGGGSSTEPQYRLLNTITLTAHGVIDVNADSNGTPYNLKKLLIEITSAVTASAMSGILIVYISDTTDIRFSLSPIAGSAVKKCTCEFEQKNGRWFGTYMQPTNDSNGNTQIGVLTTPNAFGHFAVQDYPKISRFRFGGGTLSKNTVVTVYGVDN